MGCFCVCLVCNINFFYLDTLLLVAWRMFVCVLILNGFIGYLLLDCCRFVEYLGLI